MKKIAAKLDVDIGVIKGAITTHSNDLDRLHMLMAYYKGKHAILNRRTRGRGAPNNKTMSNHAKYITTILNGYFIGNSPKYTFLGSTGKVEVDNQSKESDTDVELFQESINLIDDWYNKRHIATHDFKMGKHMSIYGKTYELLYADPNAPEGEVRVKLKNLEPTQAFLIRDVDLEETVLAGVYYYRIAKDKIRLYLYTDVDITTYETSSLGGSYTKVDESIHAFGSVPLIEYINNDELQGDYEQQLSLIDAYNLLMSDRINDKEQLVDAILVITGGTLPDDWMPKLKREKLLNLPDENSKAEWLVKNMNESDVQVLRDTIKEDIHTYSFVPNVTDENFAGNSSGVAMSYKLIGMDLLVKEKEANFEKGLKLRLKRLFHVWSIAGKPEYDYESIMIEFSHSLPTNLLERAQVVTALKGIVSDETLLGTLDIVKNVHEEIVRLEEQKKQSTRETQDEFNMGGYGQSNQEVDNDNEGQE